MKNLMKIMTIACAVTLFAACGNGGADGLKDSTSTGVADEYADSVHADTIPVSEADSTNSYRNDMGTDSVNKSKEGYNGVPRNP